MLHYWLRAPRGLVWSRNAAEVDDINQLHMNRRFFKEVKLSPKLKATLSMEEAVRGADAIILSGPFCCNASVCAALKPLLTAVQLARYFNRPCC